jgi:peroxiredoxin
LPSVDRLYRELRSRGFEVALIAFREEPEAVRRAVRERGYSAPVLLDQSGEVAGVAYGVWGPPTIYLIDRQGRLVGAAVGPRDWERPEARKLIEALLEAPAS